MFGVMRETFDSEGGSMRGEDDFFSVARTTPFVALEGNQFHFYVHILLKLTLDSQRCDALIDCIKGILCHISSVQIEAESIHQRSPICTSLPL